MKQINTQAPTINHRHFKIMGIVISCLFVAAVSMTIYYKIHGL
jgi:hypothetical protein